MMAWQGIVRYTTRLQGKSAAEYELGGEAERQSEIWNLVASRRLRVHLKGLGEEARRKIVHGISQAVAPTQIVVFGSYARGEAVESSDLDIMVVTRERYDAKVSRRRQLGEIYRALAEIRIPKDILLFSEDEVSHWRSSTNHLIAEAYRDGRLIYEQS